MDWTAFRSSHNFYNIFWIIFHHIYDTAEVTSSVATYLQFENIHITLVNEITTLITELPKSSQNMYTSTNMPINILQLHTVTVAI